MIKNNWFVLSDSAAVSQLSITLDARPFSPDTQLDVKRVADDCSD
jgi:hypothetical protein